MHRLVRRRSKRGCSFLAVVGLVVLTLACRAVATEPATPEPVATDRLLAQSPILQASEPLEPRPLRFPEDDGAHANITEWWYYTGHLEGVAGQRYGFQFVIFQSTLGGLTTGYAAHFAVTDLQRQRFAYAERVDGVPGAPPLGQLGLAVGGWTLQGGEGNDRFTAQMDGYAIDLELTPLKPPVLHEENGLISFGPAGDSWYYSRTRLAVTGTLVDHGEPVAVTGQAWMDHQWGDFLVVGGGGWDWFSVQLDDQTELTVSEVRGSDGEVLIRYGTFVEPNGTPVYVDLGEVTVTPLDTWTSPRTGAVYPSGWQLEVASLDLTLRLAPHLRDQELDTTASTGVIYWEGSVEVTGSRAGRPVAGLGYVELTGYAAVPANAPPAP